MSNRLGIIMCMCILYIVYPLVDYGGDGRSMPRCSARSRDVGEKDREELAVTSSCRYDIP